MAITIRQASISDLPFINQHYQQINFVLSDYERDFIVICSLQGKDAGLGRLVKLSSSEAELGGIYVFPEFRGKNLAKAIISYLLEKNSYQTLYCLPFAPLSALYQGFGFRPTTAEEFRHVPAAVARKLEWCNQTYPDETILLVKKF